MPWGVSTTYSKSPPQSDLQRPYLQRFNNEKQILADDVNGDNI